MTGERENSRHGPERLRVFELARQLAKDVDGIVKRARCRPSLADQVVRAVESVLLNIAEGAAHHNPGQKLYHYGIARASAGECIGALLRISDLNPKIDIRPTRQRADMVCAMLLGLIRTQEARRQKK